MKKICWIPFIVLLGVAPLPAFAAGNEVVDKVRELAKAAQADSDAGRYDAAIQKLTQAYGMAKVPALARNIARALAKQGKLAAACEYYQQATQLEPNQLWREQIQQKAQQEAADERAKLLPRLAHLQVTVQGVSAPTVSVDGVDVPQAQLGTEQLVDPGMRHVVASRGSQVVEQNVDLKEGEHRQVVLQLVDKTAPEPAIASFSDVNSESKPESKASAQSTLGWVGLGIGAAGLAVWATAGTIAEVKLAKLHDDGCRDRWCPSSFSGRVDNYNRLLTVSTVGFVVGAVGTAAGVTLLLTSPKRQSSAPVGLWIGPSTVALQGGF